MGNLDSIEKDIENRHEHIERQTDQIEKRSQELSNRITQLQNVFNAISDDVEIQSFVQKALREREQEKQAEQQKAQSLKSELESIESELVEFEHINENSRTELKTLQLIGEDVSEASDLIMQRTTWASMRKTGVQRLKNRLSLMAYIRRSPGIDNQPAMAE